MNWALISSFTYDVTILSTNCLRRTFVGHEPFFHIPNSYFDMDEATGLKAKCDVVIGNDNKLLESEEEKKSNVRHRRRLGPKVI